MKVTNKSTVRVGAAGVAVIGIIVLFLVMFAVERIDSGQTGIIVNLAGSERGVDDGEGGGGITEGASQYPWLYVYQHTVVRETQRCAASCHCLPVEIRYHS